MRLVGENEVKVQLESSIGPMGPAGPQGPQGPVGPQGPRGADGAPIDDNTPSADTTYSSSKIDELLNEQKEAIEALGKTGLTSAQINALDGMFRAAAYIKADISAEYEAFKTAFELSGDTPDVPDEPDVPGKTLVSISATYSGGNVAVGTALSALTGITVTATYSDGSTATVTGYTLSGEITEGSNTITVSYGGKTATITVTGVAESGGETTENPFDGVTWSTGRYYYDVNSDGTDKIQENVNYSYTDFVDVSGYNNVCFAANPDAGICQGNVTFYGVDKLALSRGEGYYHSNNANYPQTLIVEIPDNAVYARLCCNTNYISKSTFYAT